MIVSIYSRRVDPERPFPPAPCCYAPSWEEFEQAMALFGPATSCYEVEGRPLPPIGEPAPTRREPARPERPTGIRDEDVYAAGGHS